MNRHRYEGCPSNALLNSDSIGRPCFLTVDMNPLVNGGVKYLTFGGIIFPTR